MSEIRRIRAVDVEYVRVAEDEIEPSPLLRMLDWPGESASHTIDLTSGDLTWRDLTRAV